MAEPNPFAEARARAQLALRTHWWPCARTALVAAVASLVVTVPGCIGLYQKVLNLIWATWLPILSFFVVGLGTFLLEQLSQLHEKAGALSELFRAQQDFERLLEAARDDRDRHRDAALELKHLAAALSAARILQLPAAGDKDRDRQS